MLSTAKIFGSLTGNWQIDRKIYNQGKMCGIACFKIITNEKDRLHYREEGVFKINSGSSFNTHREYVYCLQDNTICVYFLENNKMGQLFHTLEFDDSISENSTVKAKARYLCKYDEYITMYEFYNENEFNITYQVQGPTKDYISSASFKRNS